MRKLAFSARIIDIFLLASACQRILNRRVSTILPFFSGVTVEVHFHEKPAMARLAYQSGISIFGSWLSRTLCPIRISILVGCTSSDATSLQSDQLLPS